MAVPEQTPYKEYTANGVTKIFPLGFDVLEQDHLIVLVNDIEPPVGSWSLDAVNDTVVFKNAPVDGADIKIRRDTPLKRSTDYKTYNASLNPSSVNTDFDNIWRKLQEMGVLNWMVNNDVKDLNEYVDSLNDETKAQFLAEIQKQGISLNQLESFTNQIYQNLANVAVSKGWFAEFVADGTENQKQINDLTTRYCKNINELIAIKVRKNGQEVSVSCLRQGGVFYYDEDRKNENNKGTCFNGWIRKYFGSVYLDWFCETDPSTTDCSLYLERALAVSKSVKCSGRDYLFTGRVGIPDIEQSNYAFRLIKIHGDGDTVFKIDCKTHGRAVFTSRLGKADPTSTANNFVGKVDFKEINFIGVNSNLKHDLTEANKNLIDIVFDGDRLYNSFARDCNFIHLRSPLTCVQSRGANVEGGNAYSQSFSFLHNHFYHNLNIVEADQLLNFRFVFNKCEKNYAGFKVKSKSSSPALGVCTIDYNLFEAGGQFIDIFGDVVGGAIWNNYLEYNVFEDVPVNLCQILISGAANGCVIGTNNFGGQIDFTGYDTEYVDIKIQGAAYDDSFGTDYSKTKPVLIGNTTTSRQLNSMSRVIDISNSSPNFTVNGWGKTKTLSHLNSANIKSHQESDVTFNRGIFNKPLEYSAVAKNGTTVKTHRDSDASVIVAILDLKQMENGKSKNKFSTITGELNANIELIRDNLNIGHASARIHVAIYATGKGIEEALQYNEVRVQAKLLSILQPFDIPISTNFPETNLLKKQFVEPDVSAVIESLGDGRYAVRLTNYLGVGVGTYGAPLEIYSSLTWQASVGCRNVIEQIGNRVSFIGYWW
ncbi:hypothetical protein [Acinetobacter sp. WCHAc060025]|uniref:hypothetical protein n=1 Tax=Acinetobacter sp. WCHAc060025 TaxID=2518625 RepID=UPI001D181E76|nr:hypothetical protein [Acinetobacter sp. WCHAc060025]